MNDPKSAGGSGKPVKKNEGTERRGNNFKLDEGKKAGVYKPGTGKGGIDTSNPPSGSKSSE